MVALGFVAVLAVITRNWRCGNRRWLPYEDETGFGYAEWSCSRRPGHSGQHAGRL